MDRTAISNVRIVTKCSNWQGATRAQARQALRDHKDVMSAAEKFFDGAYDYILDMPEDEAMAESAGPSSSKKKVQVRVC